MLVAMATARVHELVRNDAAGGQPARVTNPHGTGLPRQIELREKPATFRGKTCMPSCSVLL